jgi:hypothetical protein
VGSVESHAAAPPSLGPSPTGGFATSSSACLPVILVFFQHEGPMPVWMVEDLGMPTQNFGLLFTINTVADRVPRGPAERPDRALEPCPRASPSARRCAPSASARWPS